ncbi:MULTISPECIES: hypothetical protein [Sphingomonas]|uniref:hypothetical protein n=1 Tax=Sphingomonas TaxID=13687 RepID=UPI00254F229D|nr:MULTISPECIES: hypothetical protein [Sphingomonas]MDK8188132.1 hypothetical protein [Sphingomonas zeae]MDK8217871.1 hypothetical protein [Sphingomonas sp. UMB7805-LC452B]
MGTTSLQIGYIRKPLEDAGWKAARAALAPAMSRGGLDWPSIERGLADDSMQLVAIGREGDPSLLAYAIVRSAVTRDGEALEIIAAAGREYKTWAAWGMAALREAARLSGMIAVLIHNRPGWRRRFPDAVFDGTSLRIAV